MSLLLLGKFGFWRVIYSNGYFLSLSNLNNELSFSELIGSPIFLNFFILKNSFQPFLNFKHEPWTILVVQRFMFSWSKKLISSMICVHERGSTNNNFSLSISMRKININWELVVIMERNVYNPSFLGVIYFPTLF